MTNKQYFERLDRHGSLAPVDFSGDLSDYSDYFNKGGVVNEGTDS